MTAEDRRTLDLSDLLETVHIKLGGREFDLPIDIPMPLLIRAGNAFNQLSAMFQAGELPSDETPAVQVEETIWTAAEEVLKRADPPLDRPAREVLNFAAAVRLLGFLVESYRMGQDDSTTSSPLPGSSEEPSISENSSKAEPSTPLPSE